ncbi:50S ribosomal protein L4 [Fusobacterium necrophorum subsp. funduliforme]|uniref:Large ribosomal subunit protein uL4 n=4 Tax=Fusobacterium necrophorum TaxID=859 RepID=A0A4Q2KY35_9FUSO|nr:50S ribosomal protein L4 [Fusobacterium necrophorum]AVQ20366.1 50S ribosomal protein L4 [Fusobacterium necrophorum subsp. funduliforme]AYV93964.1 50S ribosomal protein L4 [Fusobacterium necrophorum subsp. funduliforme]AYV96130.1 50S ribosomal protein L4 [Fusobacterium necrophorum subsp. funduliforme]EFS23996.1 50S ribosomal protein L4 [Fusobacterium necrophorum D12]EIJ70879.1 50S ribosomal protein L4 [Fusobacterium necrophorum subsp. funduliforme ATCC 51357]
MAVLNIYDLAGNQTGTVEVNEAVFGIEPNKTVLHEVLTAELAAARQGTAATKTRAMVRGGGRKPFKQKGTGRARQGSIRAPHMVGGGVTFGPQPRSYEKKVNKKVRNLALRSALSAKVANNEVVVLEGAIEAPKTKTIVNLVNKIDAKQKQLFVVNDLTDVKDYNLYLSARNLENAVVLQPNEIGVYWLLKQEKVILTKEALTTIEEVLA